jgi:hypothetical protein
MAAEAFFPGMQAHIICSGIKIGIIGELHPEVLGAWAAGWIPWIPWIPGCLVNSVTVDVNSKEENHPISQSLVDIILEYGVICCTYITFFFGIFHFGTVDRTTKWLQ